MNQKELFNKIFDHDFILDLDLKGFSDVTNYAVKKMESYTSKLDEIEEFEFFLGAFTDRAINEAFYTGFDIALTLLGYEPVFKEKEKCNDLNQFIKL